MSFLKVYNQKYDFNKSSRLFIDILSVSLQCTLLSAFHIQSYNKVQQWNTDIYFIAFVQLFSVYQQNETLTFNIRGTSWFIRNA